MLIAHEINKDDYDFLCSCLPIRIQCKLTCNASMMYRNMCYETFERELRRLSVFKDVGVRTCFTTSNNTIEVNEGSNSHHIYSSDKVKRGCVETIASKSSKPNKSHDWDKNEDLDPETKYRRSSIYGKETSANQEREKRVVSVRASYDDVPSVSVTDYNKWQADDDIPF